MLATNGAMPAASIRSAAVLLYCTLGSAADDAWVSPPPLEMPLLVLSPQSQALFRQLQHRTMPTRYNKAPPHTELLTSTWVPQCQSVPSHPVTFSKVLLIASSCSASDRGSSCTLPASNKQKAPMPFKRENRKLESFYTKKTSLLQIRPELQLEKGQFSSVSGNIHCIQNCQKI